MQVRMMLTVLGALAHLLEWLLMLATLPLLAELLALTLAAMLPARGWDKDEDDGTVSGAHPVKRLMVVVPSHNEELSIARCVASLAAATGSAQDVIVVAHNCSDRTAEIARLAGARVEVLNDPSLAGKGHALAHGFAAAFHRFGADAVMIVDADSTVSSNITVEAARRLAYSPVVQCRYQVRNYSATWRTGMTALAFLGINVVRPRGRDRLGLSCGIFGNGFAMRKQVLEDVAYDAHSIVEDMEFHLALVSRGYKVRFVNDAVVLGDMPLSAKTSASQHSRWEGGRLRLLSDWGPRLAAKVLSGRLALAELLIDLLGLPLALEVFALCILLLFPDPAARSYVAAAFSIVLLHLAVVVGVSPEPGRSLRTLLQAPAYLFWRVTKLSSVVRASGKDAAWVRTTRDALSDVRSDAAAHELLSSKPVSVVASAGNGSRESS
jgi:GT2 family glycosyltransferase